MSSDRIKMHRVAGSRLVINNDVMLILDLASLWNKPLYQSHKISYMKTNLDNFAGSCHNLLHKLSRSQEFWCEMVDAGNGFAAYGLWIWISEKSNVHFNKTSVKLFNHTCMETALLLQWNSTVSGTANLEMMVSVSPSVSLCNLVIS